MQEVPYFAVLPFALLLGCIALLPLFAPHFWESNLKKSYVVALLSLPILIWLLQANPHALRHSLLEYVSFLVLLSSLFVVSGGIHLRGDLKALPSVNTAILGAGAVLANLLGTTGASVLLVRLLVRTNSQRKKVVHLPFFFILVVSNAGGLLTPLGDPPLFLGFLRGVPFAWTFRLLPVWLFANAWLLTLCFLVDRRAYGAESQSDLKRDESEVTRLGVEGWLNVVLLAFVALSVFLSAPFRELAMVALTGLSLAFGSRAARQKNDFAFAPIVEVAVLFLGIFITMVPALSLLTSHAPQLGLSRPFHFFFVTGALSSVLDNAPTYLTLLSAAQGLHLPSEVVQIPHAFLEAISAGAVLMGANTYVGNGPNFMVKAIAEAGGYRTLSFGRHAAAALLVLAPVYLFVAFYVG